VVNHNDQERSGPLFTVLGRSRAPRPATGIQSMPQREMNKVESKYDLLQWMKVTMAITRLKKEIKDKTQDLRALREQRDAIDRELEYGL